MHAHKGLNMYILTIQPLITLIDKRAGVLTKGDGDRARFPMEALSKSNEGSTTTQSGGSGLILILNFFLWSSSPSDSSEEKKWPFVVVGETAVSRKPRKAFHIQTVQDFHLYIQL